MFINLYLKNKDWLKLETTQGILFWSSMYLPIIVAMAATQNVKAAISGGPIAIIVGSRNYDNRILSGAPDIQDWS